MTFSENKFDSKNLQTIIRVQHNKENPYVMLNRSALWDENLSLKAVGLWARCMSRPNNWKFNVKELIKNCKEGRTSIYSTIDELMKYNYAIKLENRMKTEEGKFCGSYIEYVFFEFPATDEEKEKIREEFKKCFPHSGFRDPGFRDPQNEHLLIKKQTENSNCFVCAAEPPGKKQEEIVCLPLANQEIGNNAVCLPQEATKNISQANIPDYDKIQLKSFKGHSHSICKNDLFEYAVRKLKTWTLDEIDLSWRVLANYADPIRDIFAFVDGTILNHRKMSGLKKFTPQKKEFKKLSKTIECTDKENQNVNFMEYVKSRKKEKNERNDKI